MKVYIAVKLHKDTPPTMLGVFVKKEDAEQVAYTGDDWGNVIEEELK